MTCLAAVRSIDFSAAAAVLLACWLPSRMACASREGMAACAGGPTCPSCSAATMRVDGSSSWSIAINVGTARAPVESQYQSARRAMNRTRPSRCNLISRGVRTVGDEALLIMWKTHIVKCTVSRSA
jgi:hypothetical protein